MHEYVVEIVSWYLAATCAIGGVLVLLGGVYAVQFIAMKVYVRFAGWATILEAMKLLQQKKKSEYVARVRSCGQTIKGGS